MNKQERHEAYKIMLDVATSVTPIFPLTGFCNMIMQLFGFNAHYSGNFAIAFPELYSKKPEGDGSYFSLYWFDCGEDGWKQRIELLKQCIEETKPTESLQSE